MAVEWRRAAGHDSDGHCRRPRYADIRRAAGLSRMGLCRSAVGNAWRPGCGTPRKHSGILYASAMRDFAILLLVALLFGGACADADDPSRAAESVTPTAVPSTDVWPPATTEAGAVFSSAPPSTTGEVQRSTTTETSVSTTTEASPSSTTIASPSSTTIASTESVTVGFVAVSSGQHRGCGLRADMSVECFLLSYYPEFGQELGQVSDSPSGRFISVSAGDTHICAIRISEVIFCWDDGFYTIPSIDEGDSDGPDPYGDEASDEMLSAPSGSFTTVSTGDTHSCALAVDESVICWGSNEYGQSDAPSGSFTAVSAGGSHSCALLVDQSVVCWGNDDWEAAGAWLDVPSGSFTDVSAGGDHSCALRTDSTIVCWGAVSGVEVDGGYSVAPSADGRYAAPSGSFAAVSASSGWGRGATCGLRTDNAIVCVDQWGDDVVLQR